MLLKGEPLHKDGASLWGALGGGIVGRQSRAEALRWEQLGRSKESAQARGWNGACVRRGEGNEQRTGRSSGKACRPS